MFAFTSSPPSPTQADVKPSRHAQYESHELPRHDERNIQFFSPIATSQMTKTLFIMTCVAVVTQQRQTASGNKAQPTKCRFRAMLTCAVERGKFNRSNQHAVGLDIKRSVHSSVCKQTYATVHGEMSPLFCGITYIHQAESTSCWLHVVVLYIKCLKTGRF